MSIQVSAKSKESFDSCRFCWMCHHICPIGNATGLERNTARARALSLSLVERGGLSLDQEVTANLYECALCSGCAHSCTTGWDPTGYTREARLAAALEGVLPAYIEEILDRLDKTGSPYGEIAPNAALDAEIASLPEAAPVLLFLGADARALYPEGAVNAIRLLKKAGVNFTVLRAEPTDAYAYSFLVDAAEESRNAMKKADAAFAPFETVVCYDGTDAAAFLHQGRKWDAIHANIVTFPAFVASLIEEGKLSAAKTDAVYTPQDCSYLARELDDDRSIRTILSAAGTLREMLVSGKETMLAGQALMSTYMKETILNVARRRVHQAHAAGAVTLVTENVGETLALRAVAPEGLRVLTVEEVLL